MGGEESLPAGGHAAVIRIASASLPAPAPAGSHIAGEVVTVDLTCGHTVLGNPSMAWKVGDPYTCRKPHDDASSTEEAAGDR